MMILFYLLFLFVPGFIAAIFFELTCNHRIRSSGRLLFTALIFDLLIQLINITGLRFIKDILTFDALQPYFNCLSFTVKFAALSIGLGIVLGFIFGLICKCLKRKHHCYREEE